MAVRACDPVEFFELKQSGLGPRRGTYPKAAIRNGQLQLFYTTRLCTVGWRDGLPSEIGDGDSSAQALFANRICKCFPSSVLFCDEDCRMILLNHVGGGANQF